MNYTLKVLTPEFKAKFDAEVEKEVERKLSRDNVTKDRKPLLGEFERIRVKNSFYFMWNKPDEFTGTIVETHYKSIGLWTPEFTEITLSKAETGFQSQPRVVWNGEIKKIEDIDEVFSFKTAEVLLVAP